MHPREGDLMLKDLVFLGTAFFMIGSAVVVAFSRNILYSGFALLGTFAGAAVFFVLLSSDFVAVTQVLIYVGGILILILFAVMLTSKIGDMKLTNQVVNYKIAVPLLLGFVGFLVVLVSRVPWEGIVTSEIYQSMVAPIGHAFLKDYLLPFEVVSVVLLGALVGALVIVRREVK